MTSDLLDYEQMVRDAYRVIVRKVLTRVAKSGLPGDHHFYIAFHTGAPGVVVPNFLRARYREEMTIVLQHDFWGLEVDDDGFEVNMHFDGKPAHLVIPFDALTGFLDPSVQFGVRFQDEGEPFSPAEDIEPGVSGAHAAEDGQETGKVIALDRFRKD